MSKKRIIMVAIAGLVSFAGTFVFAWLSKAAPKGQSPQIEQPAPFGQEANLELLQPETVTAGTVGAFESKMRRAMTEKQLKSLIYEVRRKIQEYSNKLQSLELREQRLKTAQTALKKDIEELDNLRIELASAITSLKSERDKLDKSRVEIASVEKANLTSIAQTYDKMDASSAGKILANMSKAQNESADDAVKILFYMSERTKAKVLAELATSEPALAARFCQNLKLIVEKE